MKHGTWSVAFTICVNGVDTDFMELAAEERTEIILQLMKGHTSGTLSEQPVREAS